VERKEGRGVPHTQRTRTDLFILDAQREAHHLQVGGRHGDGASVELPARDDVVGNAVEELLGQEAVCWWVGGMGSMREEARRAKETRNDTQAKHTYPSGAWQRMVGPRVLSNSL